MADGNSSRNRLRLLLAASLAFDASRAFQHGTLRPSRCPVLNVLSPRQLQFWEDVDDGLAAVEKFHEARGQSMGRIRTFCKRARGELPPPEPSSPGHQPSEEHIDGLTARPFWDAAADARNFPWARELEENAHVVIEEFERVLQDANRESESTLFSGDSAWQSKVMGEGWSAVRLQRLGVWNAPNCATFSEAHSLLRALDVPLAVRGVCFARQAPGSGVAPHTDGRNFILTSHLGLSVPRGCWIKAGEEERTWEAGRLTTLDTSFGHSTGNPTSEDRHILIMDFWHPELTEAERAGLEFVYDLRNRFESGEVPFRQPRTQTLGEVGQGLGGLWKALTGGK